MQTQLDFMEAQATQLSMEDRVELADRLCRSVLEAPELDTRTRSRVLECMVKIAAWRARTLVATQANTSAAADNPLSPPNGA